MEVLKQPCLLSQYLKSNMDRFIDVNITVTLESELDLKSNMDRFIALTQNEKLFFDRLFKIQYG